MSSADELMSRHAKTVKAALALQEIKDPKELLEAAAKVGAMAKELEAAGKKLQAQYGDGGGPEERVVLTADQRERIGETTGVAMEMLVVRDPSGAFARAMPTNDRATIERMAARQAAVIATRKAKEKAVEALIKQLEKLGVPELEPVIEAIKADPTLETLVKQQEEAAAALLAKTAMEGQG